MNSAAQKTDKATRFPESVRIDAEGHTTLSLDKLRFGSPERLRWVYVVRGAYKERGRMVPTGSSCFRADLIGSRREAWRCFMRRVRGAK